MFVYSQSIFRFVQEIKLVIRNILTTEAHFRCTEHRFYDRFQMRSFPIDVVIYNHRSMLGYFDAGFYELGFHESLMHAKKELLHNVIRHELAHYITFIEYGSTAEPHSAQFLKICQRLGWGENVSRAAMRYNPEETKEEEDGVLRKVKKLMALGASAQTHEAEQAMIKSQQLLLKHNLEARSAESLGETKVWMQRILKQKKETAKMRAIADVLKTFFVSIVYRRADGFTCLEILGDSINLEIAEYVAKILESELENLWQEAQKKANLKGALAKNSFFLGIARGYSKKIEALKTEYSADTKNALVVLEKKLIDGQAMAYPRLHFKKSSGGHCSVSSRLGEAMGKEMNIRPGLKNSSGGSVERLTHNP